MTQGCSLCAWMGTHCCTLLRACGAGLLLIWGMLLPSEQSKWGISEIKCHRSEGLRVVESSQNRSLCGSHAVWRQRETHTHIVSLPFLLLFYSYFSHTLVSLPLRCCTWTPVSFPFSVVVEGVEWMAFYPTNLQYLQGCYMSVHMQHLCSTTASLMHGCTTTSFQ